MNTIDLYRDPTFTIEKNVTEDAFVKYYLQWDHDFWKSKRETLVQSTSSAPIFNAEKSYGVIKTVNGEFQRCVLAAVVEDAFYMMTAGEFIKNELSKLQLNMQRTFAICSNVTGKNYENPGMLVRMNFLNMFTINNFS